MTEHQSIGASFNERVYAPVVLRRDARGGGRGATACRSARGDVVPAREERRQSHRDGGQRAQSLRNQAAALRRTGGARGKSRLIPAGGGRPPRHRPDDDGQDRGRPRGTPAPQANHASQEPTRQRTGAHALRVSPTPPRDQGGGGGRRSTRHVAVQVAAASASKAPPSRRRPRGGRQESQDAPGLVAAGRSDFGRPAPADTVGPRLPDGSTGGGRNRPASSGATR
jgi:hypothetical protein